MKTTTYAALLYRHEAHILRPTDKAHILANINADLGGDQEGETLGRFDTEDEAIACAQELDVSPVIEDAWGSGKCLLWGSTEVVRIDIDEDGEEIWSDESSVIQYPTPEELVAFVIDRFTPEEDEEDEEGEEDETTEDDADNSAYEAELRAERDRILAENTSPSRAWMIQEAYSITRNPYRGKGRK